MHRLALLFRVLFFSLLGYEIANGLGFVCEPELTKVYVIVHEKLDAIFLL
jgi:TPP-dependent trihydroxycyclohexane-1,2-dione (THcHDO) dehydratase